MPILSENGLVSVKEAGEKPNMDAWKKTLARFYGPLLVFVLALACCFIPRPYAWIVASGIALFGLIVTLALFYKKREFFYKTLEDQCSVLAGLICLIAFAALPMGGFTVLGTLLCPLLVASSLKVLLFHLREGASERDAIEEIYAICLVKIDDKNHSSKRK